MTKPTLKHGVVERTKSERSVLSAASRCQPSYGGETNRLGWGDAAGGCCTSSTCAR